MPYSGLGVTPHLCLVKYKICEFAKLYRVTLCEEFMVPCL